MIHVVQMSYKEKMKMYMGLKKKNLSKMLIEANNQLDRLVQSLPIVNNVDPICPLGYSPNEKSTALECIHCGRGKYAH